MSRWLCSFNGDAERYVSASPVLEYVYHSLPTKELFFSLCSAADFTVKEVQGRRACYPEDNVEDRLSTKLIRQVLQEGLRMAGVIDGSGSKICSTTQLCL